MPLLLDCTVIVREHRRLGIPFPEWTMSLPVASLCAATRAVSNQILDFCIVETNTTIRIALYVLGLPVSRRFLVRISLELRLERQLIWRAVNHAGAMMPSGRKMAAMVLASHTPADIAQFISSCCFSGSLGKGACGSIWYQNATEEMSSMSGRIPGLGGRYPLRWVFDQDSPW